MAIAADVSMHSGLMMAGIIDATVTEISMMIGAIYAETDAMTDVMTAETDTTTGHGYK